MAELVHPEELLAQACTSMSVPSWQQLAISMEAFQNVFRNEMVMATGEDVYRAQGRVQAVQKLLKTCLDARNIVERANKLRQGNAVIHGGA